MNERTGLRERALSINDGKSATKVDGDISGTLQGKCGERGREGSLVVGGLDGGVPFNFMTSELLGQL